MQALQQTPMQGAPANGSQTGNAGATMPNQLQQNADQQQMNQNAPMGDPIDTVAQMLGLDLSAASSPDQQGQMVVSAVEALVTQLHQYVQQFGYLNGQEPDEDMQDDDQLQNYEDDGNEGAEDGEGEDTDDSQADEDGTDEDQADDGTGQPDPNQPSPFKKKQSLATSFDNPFDYQQPAPTGRALKIAAQARNLQIKELVEGGYISPVVATELSQEYCSVNALSLSLALDDNEIDGFDREIARFKKNGPILQMGHEWSNTQTQFRTLDHSRGESSPEESPLVKAAEATAKKAEQKRARLNGVH
jgi:hypothetical protein